VRSELKEEESSVRGTYVCGLTPADVRALDIFEGDVCPIPFRLVLSAEILHRNTQDWNSPS
jgi:hypothetical protein